MSEANPQVVPAAALQEVDFNLLQQLIDRDQAKLGDVFNARGEDFDPIREAILAVGRQVSGGFSVGRDIIKDLERYRAELDKLLSEQVNLIIHHPDFQKLEGSWRGLNLLLSKKPANEAIKVQVLNISKNELGSVLERFDNQTGDQAWDRSPIHRMIFERRFDTPGAQPFGCLVGDYQFSYSPSDVSLLRCMAKNCGAAHVPFVSAASPKLLKLKSWAQLPDPSSLAGVMTTPEYVKWNALRKSEDARYLALTLPGVLARAPYGAETGNTVAGFDFEEDLRPPEGASSDETVDHSAYCWSNAAYAFAANTAVSWHKYGFCTEIRGVESGGMVSGLPTHTFPTMDGGMETKCPTEVAIPQRRESELAALGLLPVSHYVGSDSAVFYGAQTVQKPTVYSKASATENAALSARLPYVLMVSRFAHYLKKMLYDKVGTKMDRAGLEMYLKTWIQDFCSDRTASDDIKAEKPLADAVIEVLEIPGKPGYFEARAKLEPHIALEGVDVKLGVVSRTGGGAG